LALAPDQSSFIILQQEYQSTTTSIIMLTIAHTPLK
jgi:hypothetical protein